MDDSTVSLLYILFLHNIVYIIKRKYEFIADIDDIKGLMSVSSNATSELFVLQTNEDRRGY